MTQNRFLGRPVPNTEEKAVGFLRDLASSLGYEIIPKKIPIDPKMVGEFFTEAIRQESPITRKISLVRAVRQRTGCGLRDAKEAVEEFLIQTIGCPLFPSDSPIPEGKYLSEGLARIREYAARYPLPGLSVEETSANFLAVWLRVPLHTAQSLLDS